MGASKLRFLRQARARKNYLRFAKRFGFNISYQEISVAGSAMLESVVWSDNNEPTRKVAYLKEWQVFGAWILPFLRSGDKIHFGYEPYGSTYKSDSVNDLLKTYAKIVYWAQVPKACVPEYEVSRTNFLIELSRKHKIPRNCFSSCDESLTLDDCGKCGKCYSIKLAFPSKKQREDDNLFWQ
jgi:hypothetical protein